MLEKSKLKYIQSLGHKKYRDAEGVFLAEGARIVTDLAAENCHIEHIYALNEWMLKNAAVCSRYACTEITAQQLESASNLQTPNQVLAVVRKFPDVKPLVEGGVFLALDAIRDPGNFGTLIRIADWFGVKQVVCSNDCVELYNPKVVQATMGSIARVNICYTDLKSWLSERKLRLYAAVIDGSDLRAFSPVEEGILLIGNEAHGISRELTGIADEKLTIPKYGKAESLNAAVAAGILLARMFERR